MINAVPNPLLLLNTALGLIGWLFGIFIRDDPMLLRFPNFASVRYSIFNELCDHIKREESSQFYFNSITNNLIPHLQTVSLVISAYKDWL